MKRVLLCVVMQAVAVAICVLPMASAEDVHLTRATVAIPKDSPRLAKAADMLVDEVETRTGLAWAVINDASALAGPRIQFLVQSLEPVKTAGRVPDLPDKPDAYAIWVASDGTVNLQSYDERGALFAAGRLLRLMKMTPDAVSIDKETFISAAPAYPIRVHQVGYRNTANAYDAWDIDDYEQYIRDCAVFGANGIELIPTLDPEERDSKLMKTSMWDMTIAVSKLLDDYGMDVWLWVPVSADVGDAVFAEKELARWRRLFEACPRVDAVFVPGGDPGDTPAAVLMPWLERMGGVLHEVHPKAGVWVSNQGFEQEENNIFFDYLQNHEPDGITGVVFGPWAKIRIEEMRERTPESYQLRRYPDITHTVRCQYPQPEWDPAFAHTFGREPYNPRPEDQRQIHNLFAQFADGFGTYSDGVNDDVNKMIWSALGWDPECEADAFAREYARYFFGDSVGDKAAAGLMAFEHNWRGGALDNAGAIKANLARWQQIEKEAQGALDVEHNWRLQLASLRAHYDAHVVARLSYETALEKEALAVLRGAADAAKAVTEAKAILARPNPDADVAALRDRIEDLGKALNESIGMQLDVARYGAQNPERGAVLEFLDTPLNNRAWIEAQCDAALTKASAADQRAVLLAIANWEDPGEGGFYDDLGNARKEPHLVRQKPWNEDPGYVDSTQDEFMKGEDDWRLSWRDQAQTLFGQPLQMRYTGLEPKAAYALRVTYTGRFRATMTLVADGEYEIHGPIAQPEPVAPVAFAIPVEATADGTLDLEWQLNEGRGCQVAEVWLVRRE